MITMQPLKPHAAFYLIPVFSFIGGIIIGMALIITGIANISNRFHVYSVNEPIYVDVKKPETLYILARPSAPSEVTISSIGFNKYRVLLNENTYVDFDIRNTKKSDLSIVMDYPTYTEMNVDGYLLCLKVNFPEAGKYQVATKYYFEPMKGSSVVSLATMLGGIKNDIVTFFTGIICFPIGIIIALVSFVIIISKRSSYKRMILNQYYQSQQNNGQAFNQLS
jgi:hypothetical protein